MDATLLGKIIDVDSRQAVQLSDAELEAEITQLDLLTSRILPKATYIYQKAVNDRALCEGALRNLVKEKDARLARSQKTTAVYSLADLVNLSEIPDGIDLQSLPFIDAKTGRSLKAYVTVGATHPTTGLNDWMRPDKYDMTLKGLRDFVKLFQNQPGVSVTVDVYALFESTGRRLPSGRAVVPHKALAQVVAKYLQAQSATPPTP